jgi:fluoroquinolone transport system permease protein
MKTLLAFDIKLQWRQGFWLVYSVITLVYFIVLLSVPPENRYAVGVFLIFSDTSVLGIIFVGALVLLEKQQNVLQSLFVTPVTTGKYLISKTIALTLISLVMSLILYTTSKDISTHIFLFLVSIISSSAIYTLLGLGFSAKVETLNQYLGMMLLGTLWIVLPVLPFMLIENTGWLIVFAPNAALDLLLTPVNQPGLLRVILDIIILILWVVGSYTYAIRQFHKLKSRS